MKTYGIVARLDGTVRVEDPKCPASWLGSHVYDIEVRCRCDVSLEVNAESEEEAREIAEGYDYYGEYGCPLEVIGEADVKRIWVVSDCRPEEQNKGVVWILFYDPEEYERD